MLTSRDAGWRVEWKCLCNLCNLLLNLKLFQIKQFNKIKKKIHPPLAIESFLLKGDFELFISVVPSRPQGSVLPRKEIISSICPPSKLINELKLNKIKSTAWPMLSQDVSKRGTCLWQLSLHWFGGVNSADVAGPLSHFTVTHSVYAPSYHW